MLQKPSLFSVAVAFGLIMFPGTKLVQAQEQSSYYETQDSKITVELKFNASEEKGIIYVGCDSQKNCITLNNGERWKEGSRRGIVWFNGDYRYSISWVEGSRQPPTLKIYQEDKLLLSRQLIKNSPVTSSLKYATYCNVQGIETGELAVRFKPNGASRAGLNNGNLVLFIKKQGVWFYVEVIEGPNQRVKGIQGWVNSGYLKCHQEAID